MKLSEFEASLGASEPPKSLPTVLRALWLDARGRWDKAHEAVQNESGAPAAWVHAYLHRKEGDLGNARYWYRRAGRPMPQGPLEDEWRAIAATFLEGEEED
ncbi:MAG TPA: hypothetical protein VNM24_14645 [Burkholderiales bacterium]|jgi:hypothetical protein|nr:hypothetical protein [Burkholderiales bacterium]